MFFISLTGNEFKKVTCLITVILYHQISSAKNLPYSASKGMLKNMGRYKLRRCIDWHGDHHLSLRQAGIQADRC
jgi:hypothetical protein